MMRFDKIIDNLLDTLVDQSSKKKNTDDVLDRLTTLNEIVKTAPRDKYKGFDKAKEQEQSEQVEQPKE